MQHGANSRRRATIDVRGVRRNRCQTGRAPSANCARTTTFVVGVLIKVNVRVRVLPNASPTLSPRSEIRVVRIFCRKPCPRDLAEPLTTRGIHLPVEPSLVSVNDVNGLSSGVPSLDLLLLRLCQTAYHFLRPRIRVHVPAINAHHGRSGSWVHSMRTRHRRRRAKVARAVHGEPQLLGA